MARPGLTGHRKFRRLARTLGSLMLARGALELLWDHCYESGDDYVGTADDIESLVSWTGARGVLTQALVEAGAPEGHGFLDPVESDQATTVDTRYRVHDLFHHAPEYVGNRRAREAERRIEKVCARCGTVYHAADPRSRYCSGACKQGGWRDKQQNVTAVTEPIRNTDGNVTDRNGTPAPAPAPEPAPITHTPVKGLSRTASAQRVVDLWNEIVTSPIPKVTRLTTDRETKINARLREFPDLATWRTVIVWINGQEWCRASGRGEHPNWTATLDWLVKNDGNLQRQLEKSATDIRRPGSAAQPSQADRNTQLLLAAVRQPGTRRQS